MALTWASGEIVTAAKMNRANPLTVFKSLTETVTSSTTLQNDDELFLDLAAGRSYRVYAMLLIPAAASATPDIKTAWATTGTITQIGPRACRGPGTTTTDNAITSMRTTAHGLTTAVPYGVPASGNTATITEEMIVSCSVAGRLTLQWAQNVSDGSGVSVQNLSCIIATVID